MQGVALGGESAAKDKRRKDHISMARRETPTIHPGFNTGRERLDYVRVPRGLFSLRHGSSLQRHP